MSALGGFIMGQLGLQNYRLTVIYCNNYKLEFAMAETYLLRYDK